MKARDETARAAARSEAENNPIVRRVMAVFPGASIQAIRRLDGPEDAPPGTGGEPPLDSVADPDDIGDDGPSDASRAPTND